MFTCNLPYHATVEIKQSKFLAYLCPYSMFESELERLRHEHPKARHFVTAFRYLNEYDQIVEGSSDDGEPRGTSGKPSLHVLQGHDLIHVGVIIVRYFGGTKLGTGGLVRAYSDAVNAVCEEAQFFAFVKKELLQFCCSYNDLGRVEYILGENGISDVDKVFEANEVRVQIRGSLEAITQITIVLGQMIHIDKAN